jgi:serine/threonine protein kinase/formylglycine-generating enzyme required for sulfatase activity
VEADTPGFPREETLVLDARQRAARRHRVLSGTTSTLTLGSTFAGRYKIVKELGRGGMGVVYLAHDTSLERDVALKIAKLNSDDDSFRKRFQREARVGARLSRSNNICQVIDVNEYEGISYLTMEHIDGLSLSELLNQEGRRLRVLDAVQYVLTLAKTLGEAHKLGIVHRDLKPSNIMIRSDGTPVLLDFGLARREHDERMTTDIIGTPAYMSPEQARGDTDQVGAATDIYSLGVILYELLTGRTPFQGTGSREVREVLRRIVSEIPVPPSVHRPDLDPRLDRICLKAMAKSPAARFVNMMEFSNELDSFLRTLNLTTNETESSRSTLAAENPGLAIQSTSGVKAGLSNSPPGKEKWKQEAFPTGSPLGPQRPKPDSVQPSKSERGEPLERAARSDHLGSSLTPEAREPRSLDLPIGNGEKLVGSSSKQPSEREPESEPVRDLLEAVRIPEEVASSRRTPPREAHGAEGINLDSADRGIGQPRKTKRSPERLDGPADASSFVRSRLIAIGLVGFSLMVITAGIAYSFLRPLRPVSIDPRENESEHKAEVPGSLEFPVSSPRPPQFIAGGHDKDLSLRLVLLEGGTFQMGSDMTEKEDEKPKHTVRLSPFYLGEIEVPVYAIEVYRNARPEAIPDWAGADSRGSMPARLVRWIEAVKFLNWLSQIDGRTPFYNIKDEAQVEPRAGADGYRLPTEAEFEFALGTSKLTFQRAQHLVPVNELPADDHGLKGLYGNVWEFCHDWYADHHPSEEQADPFGPSTGKERVMRGGALSGAILHTTRARQSPDIRGKDVGFRIATSEPPHPAMERPNP